ncbi:MAG: hypothetical protein RLZZ480_775 [Candidatus Parcubacteria bacterium]
MKFISNFGLSAISAIALSVAALAAPSVASAQTNASPNSSASGCTTGCPGTSQIGIATIGGIAGQFMGTFGAYGSDGNTLEDSTLQGSVEGYKLGEVKAMSEVTASGLCNTCQTVGGNAKVTAWEQAGVGVTLSGSRAGVVYGGANAATVSTVGGISTMFQPYTAPASPPPAH